MRPSDRGAGGRRRAALPFAVVLAGALPFAAAGCTEDALTNLPPEGAPGRGAATVEVALRASEMATWADTTYEGFVPPSGAPFLLVAEEAALRARSLGRFTTLPDSVQVDTTRRAVVSFDSASVRILVDTLRSVFPAEGESFALEVHALARGFDARQATWTEAAAGEPWTTPGGDFDLRLGRVEVTGRADTLFVAVEGVAVDSLLDAWRAAGGEPGVGLLLAGGEGRLTATNLAIELRVRLEGVDTLVTQLRSASPATFLFDPPAPPAGTELRIGGIPSSRAYVRFAPPERAGDVPLRGSTINRAELVLHPLAPPADPFALPRLTGAGAIRLLADPFELGAKTPIGAVLGLASALDPDSLAAGEPVVFDVTALLAEWAAASPDSIPDLRVGFRPIPEGVELGGWSFGSVESGAAVRPLLRMLVTPRTGFDLP